MSMRELNDMSPANAWNKTPRGALISISRVGDMILSGSKGVERITGVWKDPLKL